MKHPPKPLIAVVVVAAGVAAWWFLLRPAPVEPEGLSGYVEGESLYLSSPVAGVVSQVSVARGQRVEAGQPLFVMDARSAGAQADEARAAIQQGQTQVAAAEAGWRQALANAEAQRAVAANARTLADRYAALRRADPGALAAQELDRAEAEARAASAQAEAAARQAAAARAQIDTARAGVSRAGAGLAEVDVRIDLLAPKSPAAGRVEEVYFQTGEWAGANQPVVALLPDAKLKLRFFVPETSVALYRPGTVVRFECDSCGEGRTAVIAYVSPRPEFTPPVIYSRENRSRLVFMVEALPQGPATLPPGLPVEIEPLNASGTPVQ